MGSNCLGWHMAMRSLWLAVEGGEAGAPGHVRERNGAARPGRGKWIWCMKWIVFPAPFKKMSRIDTLIVFYA